MNRNHTEKSVIEVVAKVFKEDAGTIDADTHLFEHLGAKSVDMVDLVAMLEYKFNVEIPITIIKKTGTIGSIAKLIEESQDN